MTEDNKTPEVTTDRHSRSVETRVSQTRRTPWKPPSMLDAPEAPPGYQHRWIREATRGVDEPVRAEDYPEFEAPTIDSGSNAGVIGVGGLILSKVPIETAEERTAYFADQAKSAMDGVDQNYMRESDTRMPIKDSDIQRTSKVAFGSRPANKE